MQNNISLPEILIVVTGEFAKKRTMQIKNLTNIPPIRNKGLARKGRDIRLKIAARMQKISIRVAGYMSKTETMGAMAEKFIIE